MRRGLKEAGGKTAPGGTRTRSEAVRSDEWATDHEVQAIKGQSGKSGQGARKVNVLIWGDLLSGQSIGNPLRERRLRWQGSAEAIVPVWSQVVGREGLNGKCAWSGKLAE